MTMQTTVISNHLSELLDSRDVLAAVFTTYTFEPEFFELEVIPLLLSGDIEFSSDERVKQFQVREALRVADLPLEIFYDLKLARQEASTSPAMQYLCHGVSHGNSAFHAKLSLILVDDHNKGHKCLLVGAGSNNLSRAGWWDNIECQHWEVVSPMGASRSFLNRLQEDVAYLQLQQHLQPETATDALLSIKEYLADCRASNDAKPVSYYGLSPDRGMNFPRFMRRQAKMSWSYSNWTLEIISPFFAEDAKNTEHKFFEKLGVKKIHILLPRDQDCIPTCQKEYFDHIEGENNIHWAEWASASAKELGVNCLPFRRLHAKVYHFYNKVQSWAFVGSVNFSHKAMWDNVEAGFFVKLPSAGPLLRRIKDTDGIEVFRDPIELAPGNSSTADIAKLPHLHIAYDWVLQRLTGITEKHHSYTISILNPERATAIANWNITGTKRTYEGDISALEALLKNGSLVKIRGSHTRSGELFPEHRVLLQQTGWSHKPLDLPDLTPEQILAIYAGMSAERRQLLLVNATIRKFVLDGVAGEMTADEDDFAIEQFFSEYAQIFYAFRKLKELLQQSVDQNNWGRVDYYLSGAGMDSLPALMKPMFETKREGSAVTAYLLLLCCKEIFQDHQYKNRTKCKTQLKTIDREVKRLRSADSITLAAYTPEKRRTFFRWFEAQFFKAYKKVDPEDSL